MTASRVMLFQLVMLSLRFERVRSVLVPTSLPSDAPRTLLLSSYVRSDVEPCCDRSGRSWIWMAASVFRANCPLDIRVDSSATCRSVLRRRSEYDIAWTTPENVRHSLNIGDSVRRGMAPHRRCQKDCRDYSPSIVSRTPRGCDPPVGSPP